MFLTDRLQRISTSINAHPWRGFLVVAVVLAAYQMPAVFFGLDLCDAGFYLTFYDNFFTHPATVGYNFMYYLSGAAGGLLQGLVSGIGIVGMRLAGLAVVVLTMAAAYGALCRLVSPVKALLGCGLVIVAYVPAVLTLNYDLLSLLLYVVAIAAVMRGMSADRVVLMAVAGVVVGVNCFSRTPNVVGIAIGAAPLLLRAYCRERRVRALRLSAGFMAGVAVGMAIVVGLMVALGHLQLWLDNMHDLRTIASDSDASHSVAGMVMAQFRFYERALWSAAKIGTLVALAGLACRKISNRWVKMAVQACCLMVAAWLMWRMQPLLPLWAVAFAGCLWIVVASGQPAELRIAAWLGLFLMLAFPLGSDNGATNNGSLIAWVAAPVAMAVCCRRSMLPFFAVYVLVCGLQLVQDGIYFDGGSLSQKTATIDNGKTCMLHTTPQRAAVINGMLRGIGPYVHKSDTLLAFGSIPLVNYLTGTCPAMGCSWPEQMSPTMLGRRLDSLSATGRLPLILQQKFTTIGKQWGLPSERSLYTYEKHNVYLDDRKLSAVRSFVRCNGYKIAYSDRYFVLFVPPTHH